MKISNMTARYLFIYSFVISLSWGIISCGGGSSGTGAKVLQGVLLTPNSTPVAGATITLLDTGASTVSDATGNFTVPIESSNYNISLGVDTAQFSSTVVINNIPASATKITVELEVDDQDESVTVRDVKVEDSRDSHNSSSQGDGEHSSSSIESGDDSGQSSSQSSSDSHGGSDEGSSANSSSESSGESSSDSNGGSDSSSSDGSHDSGGHGSESSSSSEGLGGGSGGQDN